MALTYTWEITSMKLQSDALVTNAVVQTYWKCTGTDADGYSGTFSGATPFDLATIDPDNFTPYDQLTQAQVLGWIEAAASTYMDHIDAQIEKQIALEKMPETDVNEGNFPWDPPAPEPTPTPVSNPAPEENVSE